MSTLGTIKAFHSVEVLLTLLENMSDGFAVFDHHGQIQHVNSKALEILGLSQAQGSEQTWWEFHWRAIDEKGSTLSKEQNPILKALQTGAKQDSQVLGIYQPHGELKWLQVKVAPLQAKDRSAKTDGVVMTLSDVTELVKARRLLRQEDENLRFLTESLPGMIHALEVSPDGKATSTYASPGSRLLYQVSPEEIVKGDLTILKMLDAEHLLSFYETLNKGATSEDAQHLSWTGQFNLPSGQKKWIQVRFHVSRLPNGGTRYHTLHLDVTEKVRLESELKLSKERFELAIHGSNSGIWDWDVQGNKLWLSDVCKTMLGYEPSHLSQNPGGCFAMIHPDDQIQIFRLLGECIPKRMETFAIDCRVRARKGSFRWIQIRGNIIFNSEGHVKRVTGWNIDIHEQKTLNQRLELIANTIEEVFWMSDPHSGKLMYVSPAFEKIWKIPVEKVLENPSIYYESIHPEDSVQVQAYIQAQKTSEAQARYRILLADGSIRWVQDRAFPVRKANGVIDLVVGVVSDITSEVETTELVERQRSQVVNAAKMSALGLMAAGVAHEINNPLAIIAGRAQQIHKHAVEGRLDSEYLKKQAETIDRTAHRIAKIIRGLRTFARDSEKDPMETISVPTLIEDTLSLCRTRFSNHGIQLEHNSIPENLQLRCRPAEVSQMLLNLLNNAFDAVEKTEEKTVRLEVHSKTKHIEFRVFDSGSGITKEIRSKIMQPFFTTKQVGHGTGLGLSIVEGLVKGHRGAIWLDESQSQTCFVVQLPWG